MMESIGQLYAIVGVRTVVDNEGCRTSWDEEIFVVAAFETAGVDGTSVAVLKGRLVLMAHPQLEL